MSRAHLALIHVLDCRSTTLSSNNNSNSNNNNHHNNKVTFANLPVMVLRILAELYIVAMRLLPLVINVPFR